MSARWGLHSSAKARGQTIDQYIAGGPTRWFHVHEEIAFDTLQAMFEYVETKEVRKEPTPAPQRKR